MHERAERFTCTGASMPPVRPVSHCCNSCHNTILGTSQSAQEVLSQLEQALPASDKRVLLKDQLVRRE